MREWAAADICPPQARHWCSWSFLLRGFDHGGEHFTPVQGGYIDFNDEMSRCPENMCLSSGKDIADLALCRSSYFE